MLTALLVLLTKVCTGRGSRNFKNTAGIPALKKTAIIFVSMLALTALCRPAYSQTGDDGVPFSSLGKLKELTDFVTVNHGTNKVITSTPKTNGDSIPLKAFQFAESTEVNFTPQNSGLWENSINGRVWRLGIRSEKAYSIYLNFKTFDLAKGARLFVYGPGIQQLRGAYTPVNHIGKRLSTAPVPVDSIIIELNIPPGVADFGQLQLSNVYHDVTGAFKNTSLFNSPEGCDQNINCDNGIYWQTEKRSVCKIITDGALSTGTLIGNTAKSSAPYLLTSYHTMFDSLHAADAVFIFNYESDCGGSAVHDMQSLSGASFIASTAGLDYALLKLNSVPPPPFNPYYAGWDIRGNIPLSGVCIHHPGGRPTQIALDYHMLATASFGMGYLPNSSWQVQTWDIGSTEPGSSGAPLFNQQHRLVGTLTGGYSSCTFSGSDYFNKFGTSWEASAKLPNGINYFLDPQNSGAGFMDGYDPYGLANGNCDTISQVSPLEKKVISSDGLDRGYISGPNSAGFTSFAERFTSAASLLIPGFYLHIARLTYSNPTANIKVKIWQGSTFPEKEVYHKTVFLKELKAGVQNYIQLDSAVRVNSIFFIGYEVSYDTPEYTFAVYHAANRSKNGPSSMFVFNGSWNNISKLDPFSYSTSLAIAVTECYGRSSILKRDHLLLFPNPSSNYIDMVAPDGFIINDVQCYDISGRSHAVIFKPSEIANRIYFELPAGVYLLTAKSAGRQISSKFIVQSR